MAISQVSRKRPLYSWEVSEARRIFGDGLNYGQVCIHEGARWPSALHRWHLALRRHAADFAPNAITLGNHCYFPCALPTSLLPSQHPAFPLHAWLIHELTHVWQFQRWGWRSLLAALWAQMRWGTAAYDYGGEAGLRALLAGGGSFANLNPEQQAQLAADYYTRLARGEATGAWRPFVAVFGGGLEQA